MRIRSIKNVLLFFILLVGSTLSSQAFAGESEKILSLTLREGMERVLERNLDIAVERLAPVIEADRIEEEKGTFDPSFNASLRHTDSTSPLNSRSSAASGGRSSVESKSYAASAGITKKGERGTEITLEVNDTQTENSFSNFAAEHDAFAGVKITQPLMKNAGKEANLYRIRLAEKGREMAQSALKGRIVDTVADYQLAYRALIRAAGERKVAEESMKLAESLLDLARKRLAAEVISPLEVTQAEAGAAARKEAVIIADKEMERSENRLKSLLTDDLYAWRSTRIVPADVPTVEPVSIDPEKNIEAGLKNRSDYRQALIDLEKKRIAVGYAKNQTSLRLDLEGSYGLNGLGASANDAFSDMGGNPEWTVGVVLSTPLDNRSARSALRIAESEKKSALLSLKRLEQSIIVEIDNAGREVKADAARVDATRTATRLAEEALAAEDLKFKAGLSTSHNVLQYQDDLSAARSREIAAVIDYNDSVTELYRVMGTLLDEEGIEFAEDGAEAGLK